MKFGQQKKQAETEGPSWRYTPRRGDQWNKTQSKGMNATTETKNTKTKNMKANTTD